jgi:hypothetical protein
MKQDHYEYTDEYSEITPEIWKLLEKQIKPGRDNRMIFLTTPYSNCPYSSWFKDMYLQHWSKDMKKDYEQRS